MKGIARKLMRFSSCNLLGGFLGWDEKLVSQTNFVFFRIYREY